MAIEAQLADGRILEFPDGTDPSVIQATVKRVIASSQPTTFGGQVKEFGKGLLPGAVGLLESAATGASALLPEDLEKAAREKISSLAGAAKAPLAAAPGYEQSIGRKFGESVGSVVPVLGMAALGPVGIAGAVATGVGAGAGEARTRAEESGATAEQRRTATMLGAGVGSTEALPVFRIIQRLGGPAADGMLAYIRRAFAAGGEEAAQEAATNIAQNLIAKGIYKPDQEIIEGTGEAAGYGGATGALVQGVLDLALGRRAKAATTKPGEPTEAEQRLKAAKEQEEKARADALAKQAEEKNLRDTTARRFEGEQAALFQPKETRRPMLPEKDLQGNVLQRAEAEAEAPPVEPTRQEKTEAGQTELGLETARDEKDVITERGALSFELESLKGDRTIEARERRAEINDRIAELDIELARREEERGPTLEGKGQGVLFGAEAAPKPTAPELDLLGKPLQRAAPEPKPTTPTPEESRAAVREREDAGQLDSGIDALKDYADLVEERERIRAIPKNERSPELNAYLRKLDQDISDRSSYYLDLEYQKRAREIEADKNKLREEELAAQSAFNQPAPTPAEDISATELSPEALGMTKAEFDTATSIAEDTIARAGGDKRTLTAEVEQTRQVQNMRREFLANPAKLAAYARLRGISLDEMKTLIETNFRNGRLYLAMFEAAAASAKKADTSGIKWGSEPSDKPTPAPAAPAPAPAPQVQEQLVTEPTVRQAPTLQTVAPQLDLNLRSLLGIGPTARLFRPDGGIVGKDISDPAQAAEVKTTLEAYLERPTLSPNIVERINTFLQRPEFQGVESGRPEQPKAPAPAPAAPSVSEQKPKPRRGKPSVAVSGEPAGAQPAEPGAGAAPTTGEPERPVGRGLVLAEQPAGTGAAPSGTKSTAITTRKVAGPAGRKPSLKPVTDAIDKLDDIGIDPDTTKGRVVQYARKLYREGLIDDASMRAVENMSKDKDMGAQDVIDELQFALEDTRAKLAKGEPLTIEGETRVLSEGETKLVDAGLAKLPAPSVTKLEKHYGAKNGSAEFLTKLREDVYNYVTKGAEAVAKSIRSAIKAVSEGVLAVGIIFNPGLTASHFQFNLPETIKATKEVRAEVPADAKRSMSPGAQKVYEAMAPAAKESGKGFIIGDKPNGKVHAFKADGTLIVSANALTGKDTGDVLGKSSLEGGPKVTPAGKFTLKVSQSEGYGTTFDLVETFDGTGWISVHSAYLGNPAEKRAERLAKGKPEESRITYGCWNLDNTVIKDKLAPNVAELNGGMMFVIPDNDPKLAKMLTTPSTVTVDVKVPVASGEPSTRGMAGREERGAPPEKKVDKAEERRSVQPTIGKVQQDLGSLQSEIANGTGLLAGLLRRLLKSGKVKLEAISPDGDATVGGLYNGDTVVLYAAGIRPGQAVAVALHEVGAHLGLKNLLGEKQYKELSQRIIDMARSKTASTERALAQRALRRIPESDIARGEEVYRDEALAYFAEELVKAEMTGELPKVGPLRLMYNRLRAAVQATFNRLFGTNFGVNTFTPDQIGFLIKGAMGVEAFTNTKAGSPTPAEKKLSVLKDKKTETPAFRKWFGNSVIVDSEGEPLVVYHGTSADFAVFDDSKAGSTSGNTGFLGRGFYFSKDPARASGYAGATRKPDSGAWTRTDGGNVMPVYVSLQSPLDIRGEQKLEGPLSKKLIAVLEKSLPSEVDIAFQGQDVYALDIQDALAYAVESDPAVGRKFTDNLKAMGYDGVNFMDGREIVVFAPTQIKSATGNVGSYDINNPDIRFSRTMESMPDEDVEVVNDLIAKSPLPPEQGRSMVSKAYEGVDKARKSVGLMALIRQATADKYASVLSKTSQYFSKGVRDSFGNLNNEVLLRQADDHAKIVAAFLHGGGIKLDKDGLAKITQEDKSLVSAFQKVMDFAKANNMEPQAAKEFISKVLEGHRLFALEKQGVKSTLTREQLEKVEKVYQNSKEIQAIQADLNATRKQAIDLMVATGRITQQQADFWNSNADYVPFSRVFEEEGMPKVLRGKGIAVLRNIPGIVGSYGRPVENVLDAYAERLGYMIEEGLRNQAAVKTLEIMRLAGYADKIPSPEAAKNRNLVVPKLYVDGAPVYYEVQNEYDMAAFQQAPEVTNGVINAMAAVSRVLRLSITAMPPFAAKQVLDDAQRAMIYSGVERPVVVAIKTLYNFPRIFFGELTGRKSPAVREMESYGIVGDYDSNLVRPTQDLEYELGFAKRGKGEAVIHFLEKITKASDLAARTAVFEETMRETGGDVQLAQTRARELINFSRRGSSSTMRTLTKVVPFFNAYAQGMDVLYRAASGIDSSSAAERSAARKLFYSRMGVMFALGTVYAMSMGGDDDYEGTTEEVRDNNWIFPGGYKLPVPKEIGFLFKSIPERLVEYFRRYGTDEEQGVQEALGSLLKGAVGAYSGPNAVPSTIKPFLEHMVNYSFFMQRELVPSSMRERPAGLQYTSDTSELAKLVGGAANVSPIVVDNYLRGFFGMAASTTLMMTDAVLNPTRPDRPLYQLPFVNIVRYDTIGGREKSEFYDLREKVMKARNGYNALQKTDPVAADAFAEKNYALIDAAPEVNRLLTELSNLRKERLLYEQGTAEVVGELSGEERRQLIDEIRKEEKSVLADIRKLKKFIRDEQQ